MQQGPDQLDVECRALHPIALSIPTLIYKFLIFSIVFQVHPKTSVEDQDELSSLLQVPLVVGNHCIILLMPSLLIDCHIPNVPKKFQLDF